jgi:hypothetical protein
LFNGFIERLRIDHGLPTVPPESSIDELESPDVLDCGYGTGEWIRELLDILDIDDNDGVSELESIPRCLDLDRRV